MKGLPSAEPLHAKLNPISCLCGSRQLFARNCSICSTWTSLEKLKAKRAVRIPSEGRKT
jgi:hypothetical protein